MRKMACMKHASGRCVRMTQEVSKVNNILILKCDHDGQGIMRTPSHRGDKENIPGFVSDEIRGQNKKSAWLWLSQDVRSAPESQGECDEHKCTKRV